MFTGADFADTALRAQSALPSYVETDQPVLAHDKVRFAGEPVAAVVAADRYRAEDGAELVEVDYEPLPATVLRLGARRRTTPVHAAAPDNVLLERDVHRGRRGRGVRRRAHRRRAAS